jgi:single-stranded-DNA-specific exonuclease
MHRKWVVNKTNPDFIRYLSHTASISPVLAQILINRGVKTSEDIASFLSPDSSKLSDSYQIRGIAPAVERIMSAAKNRERVMVHGEYDADGVTATAIVVKAFRVIGIDCFPFVPNRIEHGYGFKVSSVAEAKQGGATLIVTVDCGMSSFDAVGLCRKEGIDVIITDHHEPEVRSAPSDARSEGHNHSPYHGCILPDALAVINPKICNHNTQVAHLSGAGVALKLAHALTAAAGYDSRDFLDSFLDLAALGTIADVVPMTGENRLIVKEGLRIIDQDASPGLRALKTVARLEGRAIRPGTLLFTMIPRINAPGRISDAENVVTLLLTGSHDEAFHLAGWLDQQNSERQRIEEKVYQDALQTLGEKEPGAAIVLASEKWHKGVIGIVASRIAEAYHRPAFILSLEGDSARGSARSVPSFDLYSALVCCKDLLTAFGGHRQAAGLELASKNISAFEECMSRVAGEILQDEDFVPCLEIDANVCFPEVTRRLIRELELLEPFGTGNPEPLLGSKGIQILESRILKNNHLKMKLKQKNQSIDAIGFDMASCLDSLEKSTTIDAVYTPFINEWGGTQSLQLNLRALRPSL